MKNEIVFEMMRRQFGRDSFLLLFCMRKKIVELTLALIAKAINCS